MSFVGYNLKVISGRNRNWGLVRETKNTMLQSVFEGKAAEIYSTLPSEKSSDNDTVKQEVLKAYELVSESYRQKFRSFTNLCGICSGKRRSI